MERQRAAKIAVSAASYAIDRPYLYLLPGELAETARPGMRAVVPFGSGNRPTEGIILAISDAPEETDFVLKQVLNLLDERPVLDEKAIRLALWMRERLFCTVYEAARTMLPVGLYYSLKQKCTLGEGISREAARTAAMTGREKQLIEILLAHDGSITVEDLRAAFGEKSPDLALRRLLQTGILCMDADTTRNTGDKTEQVALLAMPAEQAFAQLEKTRKRYPLRWTVVELLAGLERVPVKELCYFTGASRSTLKGMEKKGLIHLEKQEIYRTLDLDPVPPAPLPVLNPEQQVAFEGLHALLEADTPACALLYGVTGSGKTQVYIRLIHACLEQGKDAILLVPEIALTPQMLRLFRSQFGDTVAVLHSMLAEGQRYDQWKRIRDGKAHVVVGTRSAVFAPVQNLGLLILDEEQEYSYKSEHSPRYHARDMAKFRSVQSHALLVLGSATPSVETMYQAQTGTYHLFTLRQRFNQRSLPPVLMADRKQELREGNPKNLTRLLQQEIATNLRRGEQTILFLNRRGSNRKVVCTECGEAPTCTRCSVSFTYHGDNGRLMCHYCGGSRTMPRQCPSCGGALSFVGCGTQKVVEELEELFPEVPVLRMDQDTISASNNHEKLLARFEKERIPILVGTQRVPKGLDFENGTLVGVVEADQALYQESFRASERAFSLITQVVGRAGRGERTGRAVIQTVAPRHPVLRRAAHQDYDGFYEEELQLRQLQTYPPFSTYYRITLSGEDEGAVLRTGVRMREGALQWIALPQLQAAQVQVLGPVAAHVLKVNNRYRYYLNVYGKSCPALRQMLAELLKAAFQDKQSQGVAVYADWDPLD